MAANLFRTWKNFRSGSTYFDKKSRLKNGALALILKIFRIILIAGVAYVILSPVIGIVTSSFFSDSDRYNPIVFTIPMSPTLERYTTAMTHLKYSRTLPLSIAYTTLMTLIQVLVCSMVGYGFARFQFPLKKLLFGCVVLMIVLPVHTIMLPLYVTFRNFPVAGTPGAWLLGLMGVTASGGSANLMGTWWPMILMSFLGTGLKSGLYIYIFNQFFRGLPKEIEEAALVDGAGTWYTYFRIMLVNAMPALITVTVFSLVWQYNDTFYANLFNVSVNDLVSKRISVIMDNIANVEKVLDPNLQILYMNAGIVLITLPLIIMYLVLQKQFVEGVERSGIVG